MATGSSDLYGSQSRSCTGRKTRQSLLFILDISAACILAYAVTKPWAGVKASVAWERFTLMYNYGGPAEGQVNQIRKGLYYSHIISLFVFGISALGYWVTSLSEESRRQNAETQGGGYVRRRSYIHWRRVYGIGLGAVLLVSGIGFAVWAAEATGQNKKKIKVLIFSATATLKALEGARADAVAFVMFLVIWMIRWILHCCRPDYETGRSDDPEMSVVLNR